MYRGGVCAARGLLVRRSHSLVDSVAAAEKFKQRKLEEKEQRQNQYSIAHRLGEPDMPELNMDNPYKSKPVQCILCKHGIVLDYKNPQLLSQFVSRHTGLVYDKHITGLCTAQQELLRVEVDKSRGAGFMPSTFKDLEFVDDPQVADPRNPIRPHPYE